MPKRKMDKQEKLSKRHKKKKEKEDKTHQDAEGGATASGGAEGRSKERFELFYGPDNVFSQFYPCSFTVDGIQYCCMEQYMHHQKAVVFKDDDHARQIMKTQEPKKHKGLGRKVENFDKEVWSKTSQEVVKKGNIEKFKQNPELKAALFNTYPRTLVEASPRDRLWGIGLGKNNPKAHNPKEWRGKNLLGYILTEVRDFLTEEEMQATS